MIDRTESWQRLARRGHFRMDVKAIINNVDYTAISSPTITRSLFEQSLSVGNTCAATCTFSIMTKDEIPAAAEVVIAARLVNETDETDFAEWQEFGVFYVSERSDNDILLELTCYDAMLKANQAYIETAYTEDGAQDSDTSSIRVGWPKTMKAVVDEIAERIGVEVDSRTAINTADAYQVAFPEKYTMREVLGYIGACHGGNWVITPENKLRLVKLCAPPNETFRVVDYDYNEIQTGDGYRLVYDTSVSNDMDPLPDGIGYINVPVVIGTIETGINQTISRVTLSRDNSVSYSYGSGDGTTLEISGNPYANMQIAADLYDALNGLEYRPFTASSACFDPMTELGDWMFIGDRVQSVLCSESMTLSFAFRANVSAPGSSETESEYPYLTAYEKAKRDTESVKTYVDNAVTRIDTEITQTNENVTLAVKEVAETMDGKVTDLNTSIELTNGKIESEVTRAQNAESSLSSKITQTESSITAEVTRAKNAESTIEGNASSKIEALAGSLALSVTNGSESSTISLTRNGTAISSKTIEMSGVVTFNDLKTANGTTTINGSNITTGTINADLIKAGKLTAGNVGITGALSTYSSASATEASGSLGYLAGSTDYGLTDGIGIRSKNGESEIKATTGGVLVAHGDCRFNAYDNVALLQAGSCSVTLDSRYNVFIPSPTGSIALGYSDSYWSKFYVHDSPIIVSDRNLKNSVEYADLDKYEALFAKLKPCRFKYNDGTSDRYHVGFISQDVGDALNDVGLTSQDFGGYVVGKDEETGEETHFLRYEEFIPINTMVLQKLMARIDDLEARVKELEGRNGG